MPAPRSPAQVEAARRNGARSRGPVTAEGKERASRDALKHGLDALRHLVLEGEAPEGLEELAARLMDEVGVRSELEARLARRLAVAFWKGERAERMEVALLDAAPRLRPPTVGGTWGEADPLATFDVRRFNAVRGHQAAQGREIGRCLNELRQLRRDAAAPAGCTDEPEAGSRNEPGPPPPRAASRTSVPGARPRRRVGRPRRTRSSTGETAPPTTAALLPPTRRAA